MGRKRNARGVFISEVGLGNERVALVRREIGIDPEAEKVADEVDFGDKVHRDVRRWGDLGFGNAIGDMLDGEAVGVVGEAKADFAIFKVETRNPVRGGRGGRGDDHGIEDDLFLANGLVVDDPGAFLGTGEASGHGTGGGTVVGSKDEGIVSDQFFRLDQAHSFLGKPEGAGEIVRSGVAVLGGVVEIESISSA